MKTDTGVHTLKCTQSASALGHTHHQAKMSPALGPCPYIPFCPLTSLLPTLLAPWLSLASLSGPSSVLSPPYHLPVFSFWLSALRVLCLGSLASGLGASRGCISLGIPCQRSHTQAWGDPRQRQVTPSALCPHPHKALSRFCDPSSSGWVSPGQNPSALATSGCLAVS